MILAVTYLTVPLLAGLVAAALIRRFDAKKHAEKHANGESDQYEI